MHVILFVVPLELLFAIYSYPILFFSACAVLLLVHVFLFFRTITLAIDKHFMAIEFTLLKIPYRKIRIDFDKVVVSSYIFDPIVFYKGTDKVLEMAYEDDVTADSIETGTLEIRYKEKVISTDNEKTSYTLFLEIKDTVSRQA